MKQNNIRQGFLAALMCLGMGMASSIMYAQEVPADGPYKEFYEGSQQAKLETQYSSGEMNGPFRQYFLSGRLQAVGSYKSGKYHGPYKEYYENGTLRLDQIYAAGSLEGISKEYYENESLKNEERYRADTLDGTCTYYYEN